MFRSAIWGLWAAVMSAYFAGAFAEEPAAPVDAQPAVVVDVRQFGRTTPGYKNLHDIGLAMHGYHDGFSEFPKSVTLGPDGKTPHSWRVELLPVLKYYVEDPKSGKLNSFTANREKYDALILECGYDVSQPWDSPANAAALNSMPAVFRHPEDRKETNESAFYAIVGPETAISPTPISVSAIKTPSKVLMVAESRSREPWTKPVDVFYFKAATVPRLGGFTSGGFLGLTCDGGVHLISDRAPSDALRALLTCRSHSSFE